MTDWRRRCEALEQELSEFATGISHDLRAPLRAVEGFARVIDQQYGAKLDGEGQEYLRHIREGAATMARQIDALTQLARVSASPFRSQPVELDRIAGEVLDELRARDPGREVEIQIEPGLNAEGDPRLCARCSSASSATRGGSRASSRARASRSGAIRRRVAAPSTCATTGRASTWPTRAVCSSRSRGCTRPMATTASASGW